MKIQLSWKDEIFEGTLEEFYEYVNGIDFHELYKRMQDALWHTFREPWSQEYLTQFRKMIRSIPRKLLYRTIPRRTPQQYLDDEAFMVHDFGIWTQDRKSICLFVDRYDMYPGDTTPVCYGYLVESGEDEVMKYVAQHILTGETDNAYATAIDIVRMIG